MAGYQDSIEQLMHENRALSFRNNQLETERQQLMNDYDNAVVRQGEVEDALDGERARLNVMANSFQDTIERMKVIEEGKSRMVLEVKKLHCDFKQSDSHLIEATQLLKSWNAACCSIGNMLESRQFDDDIKVDGLRGIFESGGNGQVLPFEVLEKLSLIFGETYTRHKNSFCLAGTKQTLKRQAEEDRSFNTDLKSPASVQPSNNSDDEASPKRAKLIARRYSAM